MNDQIIDKWNSVVGTDDRVFILGDAALGRREETLTLYGQMNGVKMLVAGNHDYCHPLNGERFFDKWLPIYEQYFFVSLHMTYNFDGFDVDLSHFPYTADHLSEVRFLEWRPKNAGNWLLHGHLHSDYPVDPTERPLQIDVGVEAWDYKPVSAHTIMGLIDRFQSIPTT